MESHVATTMDVSTIAAIVTHLTHSSAICRR